MDEQGSFYAACHLYKSIPAEEEYELKLPCILFHILNQSS